MQNLNPKIFIPAVILMTLLIASLAASLARGEDEARIVARVIAAEAAGEGERGMYAVACVIANRARAQGKTPYQIVTALILCDREYYKHIEALNGRKG